MVDLPEQPRVEAAPSGGEPSERALAGLAARVRGLAGRSLSQGGKQVASGATVIKARLGPRLASTGRGILSHTGDAARAAGLMARRHILPRLGRAGEHLAQRTRPAVLKEDYRRILSYLHETVLDREVEQLVFVPSRDRIPLTELTIHSLMRLSGHDYKPTPCKVFEWAMAPLGEALARKTFVDIGAGRGRALLLASHFDFEKIVGVEFAEELYTDCLMNIAQYPRSRMKCRDVGCELEDATHFKIPDQSTVFYFFNPFDTPILEEVLNRISRSYKQTQRQLHLVFVDPPDPILLKRWPIFRPLPLERMLALKIKFFSPYEIAIYHTVEAGNVPPPPRPAA